MITYAGHLREESWFFMGPFLRFVPLPAPDVSAKGSKIPDSSLSILKCARNARTRVSSSRAAIIRNKKEYNLIIRLKICLLLILSNRKSVTGKVTWGILIEDLKD